jgi:hypothetical protein
VTPSLVLIVSLFSIVLMVVSDVMRAAGVTARRPCSPNRRRTRSPPKGGLLGMDKEMTLPSHECRDKFCKTRRHTLSLCTGSAVVRRVGAEPSGWLQRRPLAQYSRLVFSVLDGLRAGGYRVGACRPRDLQSLRAARGITRPLRRHAGDCLCRHLRDVADMAVLNNAHE